MAKRIISILLPLLLLLLYGCSSGSANAPARNKDNSKWQPTGQKVDSSIFGRSIEYDSWSPAENITLPVDPSEILDIIQIEKTLYILGNGGVYTLDIESGNSLKIIDTAADLFYVYAGSVYTYNTESSTLSVYNISGSLIEECSLTVQEVDYITGIYVTDGYCVFSGLHNVGIEYETRFYSYNKETKELAASSKGFSYNVALCGYKGNELLLISEDYLGRVLLQALNTETVKSKELKSLDYYLPSVNTIASCYNPQTDTLILYYTNNAQDGGKSVVIEEHSLIQCQSEGFADRRRC